MNIALLNGVRAKQDTIKERNKQTKKTTTERKKHRQKKRFRKK